jgi:hypothetical protein
MIKLAGMWEMGWDTPIREIDLWEMVIHEFEIDELFMSPVSGILSKFVTERKTIKGILEENNDVKKVFIDIEGDTELQDFIHPENVLYIFGKNGTSPMVYKEKGDLSLHIQTPAEKSLLWPHQVASMILYDRMIKQWQ